MTERRMTERHMTEPWLERWAEGRIGWHEANGNAALRRHWPVSGRRVLVPLCGKTQDLLWLAAGGNEVVGVEYSEIAVQAFFAENGIEARRDRNGRIYRAPDIGIEIHCMDYFEFDAEPCDAHYDRAALIALPPGVRPDYVRKTDSLLTPDAFRLVITVEYDQSLIDGPPYSVESAEVQNYWPVLECVEVNDDLPTSPPRFREAGITDVSEVVWCTRNA
jgi:thiopurine S-methyltransferase